MFVDSLDWVSARQTSLLALGPAEVPDTVGAVDRIDLGGGAWLDHRSNWLPGADAWFDSLLGELEWIEASRPMYDRIVDVPRLMSNYRRSDPSTPMGLELLGRLFDRHYQRRFPRIGCNLYRDGNDSVAWHKDKVKRPGDSIVAIVSLGERRPFLLRKASGGGTTHRFMVGDGDLLVLGGTVQASWEHAVPKVRHAGPRLCVMARGDSDGSRASREYFQTLRPKPASG